MTVSISVFCLWLIAVGSAALGSWLSPEDWPSVGLAVCVGLLGGVLRRRILGPGKPRNALFCHERAQLFVDYVLAQHAYLHDAIRTRPSFVSFSAERDATNIDGKHELCPIVTAEFPVREGLIAVCRYVVRIDHTYSPAQLLPAIVEFVDVRAARS